MKKTIIITGGAGLVGSTCAEYYAQKKNKVIVIDNLLRSQLFNYHKKTVEYTWNYLAQYSNIKRIKTDIRNIKELTKILRCKPSIFIHAAGQPGVPSSIRNPSIDFDINAYAPVQILECIRKISPKTAFIYCSTNKVYGENVDKIPLKELSTRYLFKNPSKGVSEKMSIDQCGHTPYGASKYVGDIFTQEYAYIYGIKTAVFRMSCIYGPRQFGFEDQGWVAHFIISTFRKKPITIYGNGKQVRDLLYAEDLVKAFDAFTKSSIPHAVYNIGGGHTNTLSLIEFLNLLEKKINIKTRIKFLDWRPSDQKVYISDITKIKKELHWSPTISAEQGIEKIIVWITNNQHLFK